MSIFDLMLKGLVPKEDVLCLKVVFALFKGWS